MTNHEISSEYILRENFLFLLVSVLILKCCLNNKKKVINIIKYSKVKMDVIIVYRKNLITKLINSNHN